PVGVLVGRVGDVAQPVLEGEAAGEREPGIPAGRREGGRRIGLGELALLRVRARGGDRDDERGPAGGGGTRATRVSARSGWFAPLHPPLSLHREVAPA